MELTIPKLTFRIEILILIAILFFILWSHVICSCSTISAVEGMAVAKKVVEKMTNGIKTTMPKPDAKRGTGMETGMGTGMGMGTGKEGFSGANINNGQPALTTRPLVDTSSWFTPNLTYSSGGQISQGIQDILNRPTQPIPLPEGELLMFVNTPFKPECCSTSYSNSMGCACMTVTNNGKQGQYEYLRTRGGNNVPYSEF